MILKTIILREIQEYLKSMKLVVGLCIALVLVAVTTIVNVRDYAVRNQDYIDAKREMGVRYVFRCPQVLSILVSGKDAKLGNLAEVSSLRIPAEASGYLGKYKSFHERLLARLTPVDIAFIIRVVMSLLVIFLVYSVVSEEKTTGTLALVMSNSVPRSTVLLGKVVGGFAVVMIYLLISMGVALLIMTTHPAVLLTPNDWARIIGIIASSVLYLGVFHMLGFAVSVAVNRPPVALAVLLQFWIFLVIIYPNAGIFIADRTYQLSTELEVKLHSNEAARRYTNEGNQLLTEYHIKHPNQNFKQTDYSDPLLLQRENAYNKAAEIEYRVLRDYSLEMAHQAEYARKLTLFSPAVLLDKSLQRLAKTGVNEYERFLDGIYINWNKYRRYMENDTAYREQLKSMPEFIYSSDTISESFAAVIPGQFLLFLMCSASWVSAHVLFLRKDVRS
jgi:ABC-type transport system involved in multi-copper enzyme maturation permease subunit